MHAISILDLTDEQINTYLEQVGESVNELREALNKDAKLHSLAHQPLMLEIMTLAYQGAAAKDIPTGETPEKMRHIIFARYVNTMFSRRQELTRWKKKQVIDGLIFLAKQMQQRNQTVPRDTQRDSLFHELALDLSLMSDHFSVLEWHPRNGKPWSSAQ